MHHSIRSPAPIQGEPPPRSRGPIVYPAEDDVSETLLHLDIRSLLRTVAKVWLAAESRRALLLSDQRLPSWWFVLASPARSAFMCSDCR